MTISDTQQLIAITVGVITVSTAIIGILRYSIKNIVRDEMTIVKKELNNNGGSSMKDKVDRNTEGLVRVESRVDDIYKILCERDK
jgi:hypothetical protein